MKLIRPLMATRQQINALDDLDERVDTNVKFRVGKLLDISMSFRLTVGDAMYDNSIQLG